MFLMFIVARSIHQQVSKCLQIRKAYYYYCLENTYIVIKTVLKEGYIIGRNILRHSSLGLYNHFNTHEAECHDMIFHIICHINMYRRSLLCACVCLNIFPVNVRIMPALIHPYFPLSISCAIPCQTDGQSSEWANFFHPPYFIKLYSMLAYFPTHMSMKPERLINTI